MTTGEMLRYTKRLQEILSLPQSAQREMLLVNLMTHLEIAYQIPITGKERIETFKEKHPHVMQLYRTVSAARSL
ncbi:hypothetical protein [Halalkalibacterium halodurans]|uniref:hypothetical protein n=1 Tax=Halalkalibacterium halodurans TaxID=86665 RepID=UPI002AA9B49D|nr:hypothetical protein [Halalkalibacterium halodurans]MDY7222106.1 hypothetical protein [Halalkalibacterium halodurans]MDY7243875.1 hypothetical protein [Halalkalibacterium halodurans]